MDAKNDEKALERYCFRWAKARGDIHHFSGFGLGNSSLQICIDLTLREIEDFLTKSATAVSGEAWGMAIPISRVVHLGNKYNIMQPAFPF